MVKKIKSEDAKMLESGDIDVIEHISAPDRSHSNGYIVRVGDRDCNECKSRFKLEKAGDRGKMRREVDTETGKWTELEPLPDPVGYYDPFDHIDTIIQKLLTEKVEWEPSSYKDLFGTRLDGLLIKLRLDEFPKEAPCTLIADDKEQLKLNEFPKAWTLPRKVCRYCGKPAKNYIRHIPADPNGQWQDFFRCDDPECNLSYQRDTSLPPGRESVNFRENP